MSIYQAGRPFKYNPAVRNSKLPPPSSGEYRIRDSSGSILYVGETCNLARRIKEHQRSGKLPCDGSRFAEYMLADCHSTSSDRRGHERHSIHKHRPLLNRSRGGEGRPAKC